MTPVEKLKEHRISRFFHSYFRPCQSRNLSLSAIAHEPVFIRRDSHLQSLSPSLTLPPISGPKTPKLAAMEDLFSKANTPTTSDTEGRRCPHPSPASPSHPLIKTHENKSMERSEKMKKPAKKKPVQHKEVRDIMVSSSSSAAPTSRRYFTSEDEKARATEALFSSSSSSSDSSELCHRPKKSTRKSHCRKAQRQNPDSGFLYFASIPKVVRGRVKRSVAVVKRSADPYSDFRSSMVEMIVEKQIYTADDLEQLLYCFLLLNSPHHHPVIVEVFSEILEAMFPN